MQRTQRNPPKNLTHFWMFVEKKFSREIFVGRQTIRSVEQHARIERLRLFNRREQAQKLRIVPAARSQAFKL